MSFVSTDEFSVRVAKITPIIGVSRITAYLSDFEFNEMAILSKGHKPGKSESQNSLKLSFTNIRACNLNFIGCKSFFESNSPDILALCETNLDD